MDYTVKQFAQLAGVTPRTLRYYDSIGLLRPAVIAPNGYRRYGKEAVLRLQQIRFYRELGFSLDEIKAVLDRPDFDLAQALLGHKRGLLLRIEHINRLVETIDQTLLYLKGENTMTEKDFYAGFDEEQQTRHEQEVRERWGDAALARTKPWNDYTRAEKNDILARLNEISLGVANNMEQGSASPAVQAWIERWHQAINTYFYECSLDVFEALGHGYVEDPRFTATYEAIRPGLAAFMEEAMTFYCNARRPG